MAENPAKPAVSDRAQPYPGPIVKTVTAWEGIAGIADNPAKPTFGVRGIFGIEDTPVRHLVTELGASYRWIDYGETKTELPGASLSAGWRFGFAGTLAVTTLAGASFDLAVSNGTIQPSIGAVLGVRAAVRLSRGEYLGFTPTVSLPFTGGVPASLSVAVGLRSENEWLLPVREESPSVTVKPALFSPDGDGVDDETVIALACRAPKSVKTWKLDIIAPDGTNFASFGGSGRPPAKIRWDGRTTTGASAREIEAASEYRIVFGTTDTLGRVRSAETALTVDILIVREGDHYKVRVPDITFPSYSWTVSPKESRALLERNRKTLERIASLFARFPGYSLRVEGHANAVNWNDSKKFEQEQKDELLPLSQKRADSVREALILLGVDGKKIRTAARGGTAPLADFADQKTAWKNRRVEFILEK